MMDQLIPVINKLQTVYSSIGNDQFELPQIVLIGCQTSGKSSILQNIIGKDFLPIGSGIVTRRPIIIQLINSSDNNSSRTEANIEWGEFVHMPMEKLYSYDRIREEIIRETDRLTGRNKGISFEPIRLKLYSPDVLNLTLVDLPGYTTIPVGDQPQDVEEQTRNMIYSYIDNPNTIIITVTAANTDIQNLFAVHFAKEVDPEGIRTLHVISKMELLPKGVDLQSLKLDYVGVINRSQQDIISKKSVRESLKFEADFLMTHNQLRSVAHKMGTRYLVKTLNQMLLRFIRECLPELKTKLVRLTQDVQNEIASFGDSVFENKNSQGALLLQILTKFCDDYRQTIEGKLPEISLTELCGGARINYIFHELYGPSLNLITPTDGLTVFDVRTAIRNATGPRSALFVPEMAFELLVKRQILKLKEPSLECTDLVFSELQRVVTLLDSSEASRFPKLQERIREVLNSLLGNNKEPTKEMISDLIDLELAHINTNHPDFIGGEEAIHAVFTKLSQENPSGDLPPRPPVPVSAPTNRIPNQNRVERLEQIPSTLKTGSNLTEKEHFETELIQSLMVSYFNIVRKNIKDMVPKSIMFFLVNATMEQMQNELVKNLYKDDLLDTLLSESPDTADKKHDCHARLDLYQKATKILNEIQDFNF
eukprot:TRINITY_DN299_c0_g1_i2.p1 TRINITY_DN299_c0_g1~~TRINITY_DN299_c0_g1_i2.p1  ORF type:complete len:651 (-),score=133.95 TRINITY_DN299_c0_g1_i2:332-2284(-)